MDTKSAILKSVLSEKRYALTVVMFLVAFSLLYLWATQYLVLETLPGKEKFMNVEISLSWQSLMWRQRAPFIFEPIGVFSLAPQVHLFLAVPNILIAFSLGVLAGLNLALSYYSFRVLSLRGFRGAASLLGTVPAILGGAACCVPTLILVLGLQVTALVTTAWSLFLPVSVILLAVSLWWSLRRIQIGKI